MSDIASQLVSDGVFEWSMAHCFWPALVCYLYTVTMLAEPTVSKETGHSHGHSCRLSH